MTILKAVCLTFSYCGQHLSDGRLLFSSPYIGVQFTFLYACIQVLVEAQIFTSGNISVANQKSFLRCNKSDIGYQTRALCAHILHSFVVLHSASPRAKPLTRAIYGRTMHSYVSNILYLKSPPSQNTQYLHYCAICGFSPNQNIH